MNLNHVLGFVISRIDGEDQKVQSKRDMEELTKQVVS